MALKVHFGLFGYKGKNMGKPLSLAIKVWIIIAVLSAMSCFLAYAVAQHVLRTSANETPIEMAEDASAILSQGIDPANLLGGSVNMASSLDPFVIVYSATSTQVVASSGVLNGKTPSLSSGVFDYVKKHGQDRFTWQPQKGVRIAAVVSKYQGEGSGYVLVGKSLREVEKRENEVLYEAGIAWVGILIVGAVLSWLLFGEKKAKEAVTGKSEAESGEQKM